MTELNDFGKVEFIHNNKIKKIIVKIRHNGLIVNMPSKKSEIEAKNFILQNKAKILARQQRIKAKRNTITVTPDKEIKTLTFVVKCKLVNRNDVFFNLRDSILNIEIPQNADVLSDNIQEICWKGINYFLKKEAKRVLPDRVRELAREHNFKIGDIKIQSSKTRWGSCSNKQNINLSFYLMLLPLHLVDYVILHELCHTIEMNHSEKFWKLMDDVTDGKTNKLKAEIKKHSIP
ncbi:SprT family zinc-dependent metalloprotease [Paludibacter sp.]